MSTHGDGQRFLPLILGTLTAFAPLSIDMYLPALPQIGAEFGDPGAGVQLTLAVFLVGLALGQLIYGPLADHSGRRRPLIVGCAIYAAASAGIAAAPTLHGMIGLRLLQALGGCAGIVITRSIVRDRFDERESVRIYALLLLVTGLAPILAPIAGSLVLSLLGWRAIFLLLCAFGLLCLGLVLFALPETLPPERRSRAGIGAALSVYGALLRDRTFMGYALVGGLSFGSLFTYISGSAMVFIEGYGVSPMVYSLIFGLNAAGLVGAAQLNRWLRNQAGGIAVIGSATAFAGAFAVLMALLAWVRAPLVLVLLPLFGTVASTGLVLPNTAAAAMAPQGERAGSASAVLGAVQFGVGASVGSLAGIFATGGAVPMAMTMALCAAAAFGVLQRLVLLPAAQTEGGIVR